MVVPDATKSVDGDLGIQWQCACKSKLRKQGVKGYTHYGVVVSL